MYMKAWGPGPMVTWFKVYCFELILRDEVLVWFPVEEDFLARV